MDHPRLSASPSLVEQSVPDLVLGLVALALLGVAGWFGLKAVARRGRGVRAYRALDPWVQAVRIWVFAAPTVFTYAAVWTATTVVVQGLPKTIGGLLAAWHSTNVGMAGSPLRVLLGSGIIVADYGYGYLAYLAVYAGIIARLEHRVGAARTAFVAGVAHIGGSVLVVALEWAVVQRGWGPRSLRYGLDVGISFVMVGAVAAYVWLASARWRPWLGGALGVVLAGAMVAQPNMGNLGHIIAAGLGLLAGAVVARYPTRQPLSWRDLVRDSPPRALPTFPDQPRPWPAAVANAPALQIAPTGTAGN